MIAYGMPVDCAPAALYRHLPCIWRQTPSQAIGEDAKERDAREREAATHFSSRPTLVLLVAQGDDLAYEHVVPTPVRTIKTRYQYIGRLPAREFPDID